MSTYFEAIRTFFVVMLGIALVAAFLRKRSADVRNLAYRSLLVAAWITPVVGSFFALAPGLPVATVSASVVRSLPEWTPSSMMPKEAWEVRRKPDGEQQAAFEREMRALSIFVVVQTVGMVVFSLPACLGWFRLRRMERAAVPLERFRGVPVLRMTESGLGVPVAYGHPAKILLPSESVDWSAMRIEAALLHEAAHVRRGDYYWQQAAWTLSIMNWYNPALFLLRRALRASAEEAADNEVLASGLRPSDYARELLAVAARTSRLNGAAVAMVEGDGVADRVRAILAPRRDRRRVSLALGAATALLVGGVTLALGSMTTRFGSLHISVPKGAIQGSLWETTTLLNGDTIDIPAIEEFDGHRERRWRPEGYESHGELPSSIDPDRFFEGRSGLFLHIRVAAKLSGSRSFRVLSPGGHVWGMDPVRLPTVEGEAAAWDLRLWTRRPEGPLTGDFAIGVAAGPWRTSRFALNGSRSWRDPLKDSQEREWAGTMAVLPSVVRGSACSYAFVAADGRRFTADCPGEFDGRGSYEAEITGKVPRGVRLVAVDVAYRPYAWAPFRNVRLQPDGDVAWREAR